MDMLEKLAAQAAAAEEAAAAAAAEEAKTPSVTFAITWPKGKASCDAKALYTAIWQLYKAKNGKTSSKAAMNAAMLEAYAASMLEA